MVRKRSRKYDSDDEDSDNELTFQPEPNVESSTTRKYSLRERKRATLFPITAFDFYASDDEDAGVIRQSSDDEDFEVEADIENTGAFFEPDSENIDSNSGLIDFEDIIRADIVVNRNKIDYDMLIEKTEIKLTQPEQPKRRGRKPKNQMKEEIEEVIQEDHSQEILLPEATFSENSEKVEIDPLAMKLSNKSDPAQLPEGEVDDDDVILLEDKKVDVIVLDDD